MKRTLSAIMALLMLIGVAGTAIACSDPTGGEETAATTTAAASAGEDTVAEDTVDDRYDADGYL
jgi:hypothetical protein